MLKISLRIFNNLLQNKAIIGYLILLALVGWGIFLLESQAEKALLTLLQITLLFLPMVTMVFAAIYYYNSLEFILLLLAQPIKRGSLLTGIYLALSGAFAIAYIVGIVLPLFIFHPSVESLFLGIGGILLSFIFTAIALLISTAVTDKARGIGLTLIIWAFFAFIYDGILLLLMYQLAAYPIERPILVLSFLNPIDITRILVIMKTEASALLGLSGAVFTNFFKSATGILVAIGALIAWAVIPFYFARRIFIKKDL